MQHSSYPLLLRNKPKFIKEGVLVSTGWSTHHHPSHDSPFAFTSVPTPCLCLSCHSPAAVWFCQMQWGGGGEPLYLFPLSPYTHQSSSSAICGMSFKQEHLKSPLGNSPLHLLQPPVGRLGEWLPFYHDGMLPPSCSPTIMC